MARCFPDDFNQTHEGELKDSGILKIRATLTLHQRNRFAGMIKHVAKTNEIVTLGHTAPWPLPGPGHESTD